MDTYKAIIHDNQYFKAFFNTFILSGSCAVVQMFMACLIGYGFAKFKFRGNKILFMCVIFTMIVPHSTLHFSMFMQFRYFDIYGIMNLIMGKTPNLINTFWPFMILSFTGLAFKNGLYIFLLRQFFRGVPDELEESAYIDGSGVFNTFIKIILPLSVPMMITVFLFAFSWQWTDGYYTNVFFTNKGLYTMRKIVSVPNSLNTSFAAQNMYVAAIQNTCGLLIMAPLVAIYVFAQKYLVQGIERSGIVG